MSKDLDNIIILSSSEDSDSSDDEAFKRKFQNRKRYSPSVGLSKASRTNQNGDNNIPKDEQSRITEKTQNGSSNNNNKNQNFPPLKSTPNQFLKSTSSSSSKHGQIIFKQSPHGITTTTTTTSARKENVTTSEINANGTSLSSTTSYPVQSPSLNTLNVVKKRSFQQQSTIKQFTSSKKKRVSVENIKSTCNNNNNAKSTPITVNKNTTQSTMKDNSKKDNDAVIDLCDDSSDDENDTIDERRNKPKHDIIAPSTTNYDQKLASKSITKNDVIRTNLFQDYNEEDKNAEANRQKKAHIDEKECNGLIPNIDTIPISPKNDILNTQNSATISPEEDYAGSELDPNQDICWSCDARLSNSLLDEQLLLIHEHPLLSVSTCATCADEAYAVEDDVQRLISMQDKVKIDDSDNDNLHCYNDEFEMEYCSWCATNSDEETLFLCDNCPRVFCERCVAIAYGGGSKGSKATETIQAESGDWFCLFCQPTSILLQMRQHLLEQEEDVDSECINNDHDVKIDTYDDAVQDLLAKLAEQEDLLEEAEMMLEHDSEMKQFEEIQQEVDRKGLDPHEASAFVQTEFETWKQMWQRQHDRSCDIIGILQDMLDHKNVNLHQFYKERQSQRQTKYDISEETAKQLLSSLEGNAIAAEGWETIDNRDLDDLSQNELNQIDEINSSDGVITMLKGTKSSLRTDHDVYNFTQKALPSENVLLDSRHINIGKRNFTERNDQDIENSIETKREYSSKRSNKRMIVKREASRLDKKRESKVKKKASEAKNAITISSCTRKSSPWTDSPFSHRRRVAPQSMTMNAKSQSGDYACFNNDICTLADSISGSSHLLLQQFDHKISVAKPLAEILKNHQKEGIKFMWDNICSDIFISSKNQGGFVTSNINDQTSATVKGCVLAHCMGLGKSLQVISLIHTLLTHPLLQSSEFRSFHFKSVLLLVPVNTIANWDAEFKKWIGHDMPKFPLWSLNDVKDLRSRSILVENWATQGGVLYCSFGTYSSIIQTGRDVFKKHFQSPGPDLIILDEAHLVLKNNKSRISKALELVTTPYRIALTGTPLQNNLFEYYRMTSWIRPGCLAKTEAEFERLYVSRILPSLTSDSSVAVQVQGEALLRELYNKLTPFVQRLDSTVLQKDLKFVQQAVIHVRPTKIQLKLYQAFKKYARKNDITSFLDRYGKLFPVNNHPGCLLERVGDNQNSNQNSDVEQSKDVFPQNNNPNNAICILDSDNEEDFSDSNQALISSERKWWNDVYKKYPNMADVEYGGKISLLLQILAHSDLIGDKVVVFSQCLRTLDFIERVLQSPDWGSQVQSITELGVESKWGNWKKNREYLRIDGSVDAQKRGSLVDQFNEKQDPSQLEISLTRTKVFLLSSRAGNVGINLIAANRVVLFDSNWNPSTDEQALHRCYRYGQKKPVFAYRFLTEGTMEEKVYSRSVNKTNLAARVIDNKDPQRNFTSRELEDIMTVCNWVQCDKCEKWRMLHPSVDVGDLSDKWFCEMNELDKPRSFCAAKELNEKAYSRIFYGENKNVAQEKNNNGSNSLDPQKDDNCNGNEESFSQVSHDHVVEDNHKDDKTKRDVILDNLVKTVVISSTSAEISNGNKSASNAIISKYYFHEFLVKDSNDIKLK